MLISRVQVLLILNFLAKFSYSCCGLDVDSETSGEIVCQRPCIRNFYDRRRSCLPKQVFMYQKSLFHVTGYINPLKPELNPICYLLALLGVHHFLHVSRIRVKLLTFRLLMSYMYGAQILDVSRSHTTTQHSR